MDNALSESNYNFEYDSLINNIPGGIAIYRVSDRFETLYYNDGVCAISGHSSQEYKEIIQKNALDIVSDEDRPMVLNEITQAIMENRRIECSYRIHHKNGSFVWVKLSAEKIQSQDPCPIYYAIYMDINEERERQKRLSDLAQSDGLTGLLNRTGSTHKIVSYFEQEPDSISAFIMIDVDHFKEINDVFGHTVGDEVLCEIASILVQTFGSQNIVSRMGGDEFCVFVPHALPIDVLESTIKLFCKSANFDYILHDKKGHVSCSVGIAISPQNGDNFHELYANADKALLSAKGNGKNQYQFFSETMQLPSKFLFQNMQWLLDETTNAIYICNADNYELLYLNKLGQKMAGMNGSSYYGEKCYKKLMHLDAPCPFCKMSTMNTKEFCEREFVKPGTDMHLFLKGKLLYWNGIKAHIEFISDDTRRAITVKNLQNSITDLSDILSNIPIPIICFEVTNGALSVSYHNNEFYKLIDCNEAHKNNYLETHVVNYVHNEDLDGLKKAILNAISQNTELKYNYRIIKPNGIYISVDLRAAIYRKDDNKTSFCGNYTINE